MMEGQFGYEHLLQLVPFPSNGNAENVPYLSQDDLFKQYYYPTAFEANQMPLAPLSLPNWIDLQQTPDNYRDYFAETSDPKLQIEMPYNGPDAAAGFYLPNPSVGARVPKGKGSSASHSQAPVRASSHSRKQRDLISRQRAAENDRFRRERIDQRLEALNRLLPEPSKGGKISQLDDIIDHIKYLQLQIKDLSRSRLGSEPTSNPFIYLEGYGHYLVHELMMSSEPLEEMLGKLMEVNPLAGIQLLESRGLFIMPSCLSEDLQQSI